jgi:hypothetical protein
MVRLFAGPCRAGDDAQQPVRQMLAIRGRVKSGDRILSVLDRSGGAGVRLEPLPVIYKPSTARTGAKLRR